MSIYTLIDGTSKEESHPSVGAEERCRGSETILVAEDEPTVLKVVALHLSGLGYKVLTASEVEEAEKLFREHNGEIDLLLSDIIMPVGDGLDLYERLRAKRSSLAVLFMSGYADPFLDQRSQISRGVFYIQKPFTPVELAQKVREVLNRSKSRSQE